MTSGGIGLQDFVAGWRLYCAVRVRAGGESGKCISRLPDVGKIRKK